MVSAAFALSSALSIAPAVADDLAAGEALNFGIEVFPNQAIRYLELDLTIGSFEIISVSTLRNDSDAPVAARVSVRLPSVGPDLLPGDREYDLPIPIELPTDNYFNLAVVVNGRPIGRAFDGRAWVDGIDRTTELEALGVPLHPFAAYYGGYLEEEGPLGIRHQLLARGLIEPIPGNPRIGGGYRAAWRYEAAFSWVQVFEPARTVVIEVRQSPIANTAYDEFLVDPLASDVEDTYCLSGPFLARIRDWTRYGGSSVPSLSRVSYSPGRGWRQIDLARLSVSTPPGTGFSTCYVQPAGTEGSLTTVFSNLDPSQQIDVLLLNEWVFNDWGPDWRLP